MNNSIAGAAVAGLVGAVVAVVVIVSGLANFVSRGGGASTLSNATIFIDKVDGGGCVITTIPQTIGVVPKNGKVEWSIFDRCGLPANTDVEIKFKSQDPLDSKCNHKGKQAIKCDVNSKSPDGLYPYSVIAGSYREDPDLEIAP